MKTHPQFTVDLFIFTKEILNRKLMCPESEDEWL